MLSNTHFYHRITRKIVVSFGTIFNNMKLYRYSNDGLTEIERINVPIQYTSKEKFYMRTTQDPELTREVEMNIPRMGFELNSITYDPLRKVSSYNKLYAAATDTTVKQIPSAPYNFDFTLYIYVRNVEDGTQIVEQILPYFSPDYTVKVNLIDEPGLAVDVPIILNSINYEVTEAEGSMDEIRNIMWTLQFTAKAYLYGAVPAASSTKIIRTAYGNTYSHVQSVYDDKTLLLANTTGDFRIGELVYSGPTLPEANAKSFVKSWSSRTNRITLDEGAGYFTVGDKIRGAITGTVATISAFSSNNVQLTSVRVTPDPIGANANSDFGFTEVITEFPHL